jgi:hypothetical protein
MKSIAQPKITKFMTLAEAGDIWLSGKQRLSKPKTIECCRSYIKALLDFFGNPRLHEINAGSLVAYQTRRCAGARFRIPTIPSGNRSGKSLRP